MAFIGNTVRLVAKFRNFEGALTDPTGDITLRFYDHRRNQIGADVKLSAAQRTATGTYAYNYVIPQTAANSIIYEFAATVDGMPSVGRGQIPIRWV